MHTVQETPRAVTFFSGHPDEIDALVEQAKHPQPPVDAPPMYPCPCCEKTTAWYVGRSSSWFSPYYQCYCGWWERAEVYERGGGA